MGSSDFDLPLPDFLEAIAREEATPGGGSVSAVAGAMAAALVEMAAQYAHDWDGSAAAAEKARTLREQLAALAAADGEAYEAFLKAEPSEKARALEQATKVPLSIGKVAAEVVDLANLVAARGNRNLLGDAFVAARLASAATEAATRLAEINLAARTQMEGE